MQNNRYIMKQTDTKLSFDSVLSLLAHPFEIINDVFTIKLTFSLVP